MHNVRHTSLDDLNHLAAVTSVIANKALVLQDVGQGKDHVIRR